METYYVSCKKNTENKMLESNCSIFGKKKSSTLKIKEQADYWAKVDKTCFPHDSVDDDRKDLTKWTLSDNVLKYKAYKTALNP